VSAVYGIDLGTTNSAVATLTESGRIEVLPNEMGRDTTPSAVFFGAAGVVVGAEALERAPGEPDSAVLLVKRLMGTQTPVHVAGQVHTPESISAIILRQLVSAAGDDPSPEVVITVPAYFGTAEREATFQAGTIAGVTVLELLDEPVAAIMPRVLAGGTARILVYDLGGGTFDSTVITLVDGALTVVATDGHHRLGGADVDVRLLNLVLSRVEDSVPEDAYEGLADDGNALAVLRREVEAAKKALSSRVAVDLRVRTAAGVTTVTVTREDLRFACLDLFETTMDIVRTVLDKAKAAGVQSIDEIVLVGGSSRITVLAELLESSLGIRPRLVDPDLAVAKGAALRAHLIRSTPQFMKWSDQAADPVTLVQSLRTSVTAVAPRAIGILVDDSHDPEGRRSFVDHLITAGMPLPVRATKTFATILDRQNAVRIRVYEQAGATASENVDHNRLVLDGEVSGFGNSPDGTAVDVTLEIAVDGRMTLTALDRVAGRELRLEAFVEGVVDSAESDDLARSVAGLIVRG
jgi:molecular chaperone DnaK (HSP70)